jgi:2-polyprenyl-3-methyl-5-hydroxy-6-metoxy-1,4-benzoquinol methylase
MTTPQERKPDFYYEGDREDMLKFVPADAKVILEVGCGEGNFAYALKRRNNAEVWGMELDPVSGRKAGQQLDRVFVGDAALLAKQLPDRYFDAVIFNDVLEHMVDPYSLLDYMKGKLKPGGVVVSSIPNIRYFRALIEIIWHGQWRYTDYGTFDKTHLRFFTRKSIADMYRDAGYRVLRMEGTRASKSIRPFLLNLLFLGKLSDSKYLQFATVATPA